MINFLDIEKFPQNNHKLVNKFLFPNLVTPFKSTYKKSSAIKYNPKTKITRQDVKRNSDPFRAIQAKKIQKTKIKSK